MRQDAPKVIDICIPTWNSGAVISKTLECLEASISKSDVELNNLIIIDNKSDDDTISKIHSSARNHSWQIDITVEKTNLPEARRLAVDHVDADWFMFLDDDVRISEDYIQCLLDTIAPGIGAVQGRKVSNTETPWQWTRRRVNRGGTHATMIRADTIHDIQIPSDLLVLEDEYIRRHVESKGYIWVFNHQARFEHNSMGRHGIDWEQGYLAGKYGLMPNYVILLSIGEAIISDKDVSPRIIRLAGWVAGRIRRRFRKD